ncbi:hypothetical protein ACQPZJ_33570 [Actinoplanes sp. CA-054009]
MDSSAGRAGLYLGLFAAVWLSVPATGGVPRVLLAVASVAALLTAGWGLAVLLRAGRAGREPRDRAADRRFLLIVLAEFAAAGAGALLLALAGQSAYTPALISAVVGLHFFPLVPVLGDPRLRVLGAVVCAVAVVALIAGLATSIAPGLIAGTGTGLALLAYAVLALTRPTVRSRIQPTQTGETTP